MIISKLSCLWVRNCLPFFVHSIKKERQENKVVVEVLKQILVGGT